MTERGPSSPASVRSDSAHDDGQDVDALRATAANSVKWGIIQMVGATGGRLLFTFVLARLIGPEDFGIVAQAMIYITLSIVLLDQGFGPALVQRRELRDDDVRAVAALNLLLGGTLMVLTLLLAPAVARFFDTPELTDVLRVLAVGLVVKGLSIVPMQLCRRQFQFRELAILQCAAVLVGGSIGIVVAREGAGYWALVVQTMVADVLMLVGLLAMRGRPRFRLDLARLRSMFAFSVGLVGSQLLSFAGGNLDNIVVGRVLGPTALAFYALSFRIQRFPMQVVGSVVNDVALPIFSRLQDHPQRMNQWFYTATRFVTLMAWPALTLIAVSADVAIPFFFRQRWEPAVTPMQLLGIAGLIGISRWLFRPLLTAHGRTDVVFVWSLIQVTLFAGAVLVSVQWGVDAVAGSIAVVAAVMTVPHVVAVSRVVGFSVRAFAAAHVPSAIGCVALAAAWRGIATVADRAGAEELTVLVVASASSLAAYTLAVWAVRRTVFTEVRAMIGLARERRSDRAPTDHGRTSHEPAVGTTPFDDVPATRSDPADEPGPDVEGTVAEDSDPGVVRGVRSKRRRAGR